ncbi:protein DMP2 [Eucalyptus grandis]|uniref:Protein DMP2-like n=1 Tax=Eucalyptus globulus TaxID=34317 RepID=A0ABD3JNN4_EUCGL|nr:protein DMP2 [Eucalyptus grandis]
MVFTSSPKPKIDASKLKGFRDAAFSSVGNFIKLLPTGTVFTFQFLNPLLTNNGHCDDPNELLSRLLIIAGAFSCAFSCFTDSYTGSDGNVHYGFATGKGLWPSPASELVDLSKYKLKGSDFVHALLSTIVFMVTALLDPNTVECLYSSSYKKDHKVLLKAVPAVIGAISSAVFMAFPSNRHGIGYPFSSDDSDDQSASKEVE